MVPIPYYADNETVDTLFAGVNGVLIPGGGSSLPASAVRVWENAIAANDAGTYFPLWGTCNGFEWLVELAGGTLDSGFDAENISSPLVMTDDAPTSRLFNDLDDDLYALLQDPVNTSAFNNHMQGITPEHFAATASLTDMFTVLSTSEDREGKGYVSTMESKKYPFYGVQWHPEKDVWELGEYKNGMPYEAIPHSIDAMRVTHHLSQRLIKDARQNSHAFPDYATEQAALIWNFPVFMTGPSFVQEYVSYFEFDFDQ